MVCIVFACTSQKCNPKKAGISLLSRAGPPPKPNSHLSHGGEGAGAASTPQAGATGNRLQKYLDNSRKVRNSITKDVANRPFPGLVLHYYS